VELSERISTHKRLYLTRIQSRRHSRSFLVKPTELQPCSSVLSFPRDKNFSHRNSFISMHRNLISLHSNSFPPPPPDDTAHTCTCPHELPFFLLSFQSNCAAWTEHQKRIRHPGPHPIVIHIAHAKNQRVEGGQERNGQGHDPSVSQRRLTCRKIQIQNNKREFVNGGVETQTTTGKQPRAQHLVPGSDIGLVAMFVY
jgi:hypothetical protein